MSTVHLPELPIELTATQTAKKFNPQLDQLNQYNIEANILFSKCIQAIQTKPCPCVIDIDDYIPATYINHISGKLKNAGYIIDIKPNKIVIYNPYA